MNRYHRGYPRRTCKPAVASTSRRTNLDAAAMTCSMSSSRSRQRWRTSSSCASRAASASACSAARRADRACSSASSPRQRLSLSVRSATLCAAAGSSSCSSFQSRARSWRASSSRAERSCCEFEKRCQVRVSQRWSAPQIHPWQYERSGTPIPHLYFQARCCGMKPSALPAASGPTASPCQPSPRPCAHTPRARRPASVPAAPHSGRAR